MDLRELSHTLPRLGYALLQQLFGMGTVYEPAAEDAWERLLAWKRTPSCELAVEAILANIIYRVEFKPFEEKALSWVLDHIEKPEGGLITATAMLMAQRSSATRQAVLQFFDRFHVILTVEQQRAFHESRTSHVCWARLREVCGVTGSFFAPRERAYWLIDSCRRIRPASPDRERMGIVREWLTLSDRGIAEKICAMPELAEVLVTFLNEEDQHSLAIAHFWDASLAIVFGGGESYRDFFALAACMATAELEPERAEAVRAGLVAWAGCDAWEKVPWPAALIPAYIDRIDNPSVKRALIERWIHLDTKEFGKWRDSFPEEQEGFAHLFRGLSDDVLAAWMTEVNHTECGWLTRASIPDRLREARPQWFADTVGPWVASGEACWKWVEAYLKLPRELKRREHLLGPLLHDGKDQYTSQWRMAIVRDHPDMGLPYGLALRTYHRELARTGYVITDEDLVPSLVRKEFFRGNGLYDKVWEIESWNEVLLHSGHDVSQAISRALYSRVTGPLQRLCEESAWIRRHVIEGAFEGEHEYERRFLAQTGRLGEWATEEDMERLREFFRADPYRLFKEPLIAEALFSGPERLDCFLRYAKNLQQTMPLGLSALVQSGEDRKRLFGWLNVHSRGKFGWAISWAQQAGIRDRRLVGLAWREIDRDPSHAGRYLDLVKGI